MDQSPAAQPPSESSPAATDAPARAADEPGGRGPRLWLGLGLLAVPVAATVIAYVLPTLRTIAMSLEHNDFTGEPSSAGSANFEEVLGKVALWDGLAELALPVLGTVLAGAVTAPLVAWCLHRGGAGTRMAGRLVFGPAVFLFAPAAMVIAWFLARITTAGFAESTLLDWTSMLSALLVGAGVLVALAAFRGGDDTGKTGRTVVVAAALTGIAITAAGLQTFTFTYITGFPAPPGSTPVARILIDGLQSGSGGLAAATSTVLLAALAILGLGAALLFALARVRIDVGPGSNEPRRFKFGPGIGSLVLLVVFGGSFAVSLLPWLTRLPDASPQEAETSQVMVNTWLPPLATSGVAILAALVGGFAIGALRPLGDGSRWLLLAFAPWLFVGTGPLAMARFEQLQEAGQLMTFAGLVPRAWIALPALFVFTALFWGLEDRRRAELAAGVRAGRASLAVAGRAWPLVLIVGLAVLTANTQDTIWQVMVGEPTAITELISAVSMGMMGPQTGVNVGGPIVALAATTAVMVIAAICYLPRVGVRVGR